MGGYIERISGEIADILLREGIDYVQTKAVFKAAREKAGLHAPKVLEGMKMQQATSLGSGSAQRWLPLIAIVYGFLAIEAADCARAEDTINKHCLIACPKGAEETNQCVQHEIFTLSSNPTTKLADWVAYKVEKSNFTSDNCIGGQGRNWSADPSLETDEIFEPRDYKDAHVTLNVDRGHQVPLATFKCHSDWSMTNYLSNILPRSFLS